MTTAAEQRVASAIEAADRGDHAAAEALCREAVALSPGYAPGWINLGLAVRALGRLPEAVSALEQAVVVDPESAPAHYNLGLVRVGLGLNAEAIVSLQAALRHRPRFTDALILLAHAQEESGDAAAALTSLRAALAVEPQHPGALNNCAALSRADGDLDGAARLFQQAIEAAPGYVDARNALCSTLTELGRVDEALALSDSTLAAFPNSHEARCAYLFTRLCADTLSLDAFVSEHRRVAALYESEVPARATPFRCSRDPDRPLRIGYLSGDFRRHAIALFIEPVLERRDRDAVTTIAYSVVTRPDEITARLRGAFDEWHDAAGLDDASLSARIEDDGIDMLVDLSGYTDGSRIGVFARRCAPVQLTWLGYVGTTGLARMDYRVCDAVTDPPGTADAGSSERLLRLPDSQWCFRPPSAARVDPAPASSPAEHVRFGSFNQFGKVSRTTVRLWTAVMRAVPDSSLAIVGVPEGACRRVLRRAFEDAGVDAARVDLFSRLPHAEYYEAFRGVDVCLDTTPFSGGTTTCDALWMGVPVVTLAGERPASRSAASLLTAAGCSHWIAASHEDYVTIAAELARHGPVSGERRREIRRQFQASPAMNEAAFTRDLEAAFRSAWKRWCAS